MARPGTHLDERLQRLERRMDEYRQMKDREHVQRAFKSFRLAQDRRSRRWREQALVTDPVH